MRFSVNGLTSRLRKEERGATAVEYGIMVSLIAVVIIVAVTLLGNNLV
jgi:pilus assembly protein Flp/PilA